MKEVSVEWRVPARDGNACYRPAADRSSLRDTIQTVVDALEPFVEFSFRETLTTAADEGDSPRLVIEGIPLNEWVGKLTEDHRSRWKSTVRPALRAGRFEVLKQDGFLRDVLRCVIQQGQK